LRHCGNPSRTITFRHRSGPGNVALPTRWFPGSLFNFFHWRLSIPSLHRHRIWIHRRRFGIYDLRSFHAGLSPAIVPIILPLLRDTACNLVARIRKVISVVWNRIGTREYKTAEYKAAILTGVTICPIREEEWQSILTLHCDFRHWYFSSPRTSFRKAIFLYRMVISRMW